jgi:DNA primase
MTRPRISESALAELRLAHPVDELAGKMVALRRLKPGRFVGPCPLHSPDRQARDSTAFECWSDGWVCARCQEGGDVIKLIMLVDGVGFVEAFDRLGGKYEIDPEQAKKLEHDAKAKAEKRKRDENWFRERERSTAFDIWVHAKPILGTEAEASGRKKKTEG